MPSSYDTSSAELLRAAHARAPVTDRVNIEPPILNGMNKGEAAVIAPTALVVFLLIGGFVFALTDIWQVMLILPLFGTMATLWYGSRYLARIKRDRPDGFYNQAIHLWRVEHGLARPKFIRHAGWWALGRTLDFSLASRLDPPKEEFTEP